MDVAPLEEILVIGHGFVGEAVCQGMRHAVDVVAYDIKKGMYIYDKETVKHTPIGNPHIPSLDDMVDGPSVIFVCVPTPMKEDGSCCTSIVEQVLSDLDESARKADIVVPVIIKSTVPPGTTRRLNGECANLEVMFSPEFLTEANHIEDFKSQTSIFIGCCTPGGMHVYTVFDMFNKAYPDAECVDSTPETMEMVKYTINCYLATKVSFANEIFQICDKLGVDYNRVRRYILHDERLGKSHWQVPGPMPLDDGSNGPPFGFGGSCFPKDINSLINVAEKLGVSSKVLKAAWNKNLEVRPDMDWKKLEGRAVVQSVCR